MIIARYYVKKKGSRKWIEVHMDTDGKIKDFVFESGDTFRMEYKT